MQATQSHIRAIQLTPPGRGAIATLRIEGPGAVAAVQPHFHRRDGRTLMEFPLDRPLFGRFGGERGEEVVVRRCADDAVELHCHGGTAAVAMIEKALLSAGGQRLAWRDWTAASQTDPIKAAALTALADAPTQRTAAILLDQYHGALGRALSEIRQALDNGDCDSARRQAEALLARVDLGRHLIKPWRVVLAGRVNVGKSRLSNCLVGYDRSIVHPTPGTTRDAVAVATVIDGWSVELCDTAGLRQVGTGPFFGDKSFHANKPLAENMDLSPSDTVERAGIELARERLAQADLPILIFDLSRPWSAEDQTLVQQWPNALLVHNKCDLPPAAGERPRGLLTSALRGDGVEKLLDAIVERLIPNPPSLGAAVPFTEGQIQVILDLADELARRVDAAAKLYGE